MNVVGRLNTDRLADVLEETIRQENEGHNLTRIFRTLQNQVCCFSLVKRPSLL